MTPKEKANDILDTFWLLDKVKPMLTEKQAKQCALIAIEEIITFGNQVGIREPMMYWNKVKTEILKL